MAATTNRARWSTPAHRPQGGHEPGYSEDPERVDLAAAARITLVRRRHRAFGGRRAPLPAATTATAPGHAGGCDGHERGEARERRSGEADRESLHRATSPLATSSKRRRSAAATDTRVVAIASRFTEMLSMPNLTSCSANAGRFDGACPQRLEVSP